MSPKTKTAKKKASIILDHLSKKENQSLSQYKELYRNESWYDLREKVKVALKDLSVFDAKSYNINTITGIAYRELKRTRDDIFYIQLNKKFKKDSKFYLNNPELKYYDNKKRKVEEKIINEESDKAKSDEN